MVRNLVLAFALLWAALAQAQTVPGRFPANTIYGNPTGAEANPRTATPSAVFDSAFCATNGQVVGRVAGTWGCVSPATITQVFKVTDYGAICNGATDDTTAIQNAVTAWKASASAVGPIVIGTNILEGPGLGKVCKVTGPLDFTNIIGASSFSAVVRDLNIYAVYQYTGPVGTISITNAGNYTTSGTYNNVPLTGGSGSGCTAASITVAGNVVTSVVLSKPGCGTAYATDDTLSAATANLGGTGSGGLVLTVNTLSGGAVIDAIGSRFVHWENVTIDGDCTSIPNALFAVGMPGFNVNADEHYTEHMRLLGCWQFAARYLLASESFIANGGLVYSSRNSGHYYGSVLDGSNHFNWSSSFITINITIDVASMSFNQPLFMQDTVSAGTNCALPGTASCGIPWWIGRVSQPTWINSYSASAGTCGAILYSTTSGTRTFQPHFQMHFETINIQNTFCIQGPETAQVLDDFHYEETSSQLPAGNTIFSVASNITTVTANNLYLSVSFFVQPTATIFGSPSKWTVTPQRIYVPAATNYVAPATLKTGGWICFGSNACTPSGGGGSATNYLAGDGTWTVPPGATSGTVTSVAAGTGITVSPSPIIGAGTVSLANPSATTIGGIQSKTAVASQWLNSISTSGVPSSTQPAFTDISGSLAGTQTPAYTGDVTKSAGGTVTVLANIPTATPMAGSLLATNIAAPGTPAAGKSSIYVDSTNKVLSVKTDVPTVSNTVVPSAAGANQFATAISAAGVVTYTQPTLANISGVASGANNQVAVYTGTNAIGGTANHTISTGTMTHGVAGSVVGSSAYTNATSGTVTFTPVTGALGSTVLNLPVRTATATVATTTGTLTNGNCTKVGDISGNMVDAGAPCLPVTVVTPYSTPTTTTQHTFNTNTIVVRIIGCGPGGGGGSGARVGATSSASGGSGGGGGGCFDRTFRKSELGASIFVQVGTGGTGGTQATAGPIAGVAGSAGNVATCVSSATGCTGTLYIVGGFGGGGGGGQLAGASASGAGGCVLLYSVTSNGANTPNGGSAVGNTIGAACLFGIPGVSGANGANTTGASYAMVGGAGGGGISAATGGTGSFANSGATGGSAGGGITTPSTNSNGANGSQSIISFVTNAAGGTSGTPTGANTIAVTSSCVGASGAAGGYGNSAGVGGNGGAGIQGGGGGGGGSAPSASATGVGGTGGNGFVCVFESL